MEVSSGEGVMLECPHCGHVIRPRDETILPQRRLILCSMCKRWFRNPYHAAAEQEEGIEVSCPHCGYRWTYRGRMRVKIACPSCYKKFLHPQAPAEFKGKGAVGTLVKCRRCGYEWKYKGKRTLSRVQCPACGAANPEPLGGTGNTAVEKEEEKAETQAV